MSDEDRTIFAITSTKESAKEIIETAFTKLAEQKAKVDKEEIRLFFPNGIELISLTVTVADITVAFTVAGEKGIKPSSGSEQIGRDPWKVAGAAGVEAPTGSAPSESKEIGGKLTGEVAQEVKEKQLDNSLRS